MNVDETIDTFRRGALEIDCKNLVLTQSKEGGARFEGPGYIKQNPEGYLTFKLYAIKHENTDAFRHMHEQLSATAIGKLHADETFYHLAAEGHDGTAWDAKRLRPVMNWDTRNGSVLATGQLQSITALLYRSLTDRYLRLHFFEEYDVPVRLMSQTEEHGTPYMVRDRVEFEACGSKFEVRKREGSGDTIIEANSTAEFPKAFSLRIQEALQYLTGKSAFWRVRIESEGATLAVELASPWRRSTRSQLNAPIARNSIDFYNHGWSLFACYLAYVVGKTGDTHWNPVAYHVYNATESSANSVDAWAIGVSVAVEAIASLVRLESGDVDAERISRFQGLVRDFVAEQTDFADLAQRMTGLVYSMTNRRPQDVLYALADAGRVERSYISAWTDLRNRHVHPKLKDLGKPSPIDYQELFDKIHRAEVLLRQLTFHLIGYEGPFTDYGAENWPSKSYPLAPTRRSGADQSTTAATESVAECALARAAWATLRGLRRWYGRLTGA